MRRRISRPRPGRAVARVRGCEGNPPGRPIFEAKVAKPMSRTFHFSCRLALPALLALAAGPGCGMLGAVAYKVTPPPTVKAHYTPKKEPLVVLVEKKENPAELWQESDRLARLITERLKRQDVAPTIDPV